MNSKEPTWTHLLKQGPKPYKLPCFPRIAIALVVLVGLATGLVIR